MCQSCGYCLGDGEAKRGREWWSEARIGVLKAGRGRSERGRPAVPRGDLVGAWPPHGSRVLARSERGCGRVDGGRGGRPGRLRPWAEKRGRGPLSRAPFFLKKKFKQPQIHHFEQLKSIFKIWCKNKSCSIFQALQLCFNDQSQIECGQECHFAHECKTPPPQPLPKHARPFAFNAHYMVRKDTKGRPHVVFLGPPNKNRPRQIWVAKSLVEKVVGPRQVWMPKQQA